MTTKSTIAALATALAAAGVAVGSGATFSAGSPNPANTFSSGALTTSNTKAGAAIVTGDNMKPGDVKTGEVTIKNTGSLAGTFKLSETNVSNSFGADSLHLEVKDVTTNASVYNGDVGEVSTNGITLGTSAAGAEHTYRFTVTLDADAPNSDQNKSASADYEWTAVQS